MTGEIKTGIIGLLVLLAGFGGAMMLSQEEYDNAYVCPLTDEWGVFYGGLSSSGQRAYPLEGTTKGYKDCKLDDSRAEWIKLSVYAESLRLSAEDFINTHEESVIVISGNSCGKDQVCYECSPAGCVLV